MPLRECPFEGFAYSLHRSARGETIDDDVHAAGCGFGVVHQIHELIANHSADEAIGLQLGDCRGCRRWMLEGDQKARAFGQLGEHFGGGLRGFAAHFVAAGLTDHMADFCEQEPQVVVGFRDGADGAAAGAAGRFVSDADRRRQAGDPFGGGSLRALEKLARVGGEGFDVAALALGVERVQREAGFAAAAEPAEDNQLAVRDVEIDPLEVMHLDASQRNAALGHCCRSQLPSDTTTQLVMIARRNTMGQLWRPQVVLSYGF